MVGGESQCWVVRLNVARGRLVATTCKSQTSSKQHRPCASLRAWRATKKRVTGKRGKSLSPDEEVCSSRDSETS
jgi:hypothetical protein